MVLLTAIATIGAIGIGIEMGIQSAQAGQNDNSQGNYIQGTGFCRFGCENLQGNQN